MSTTASRTSTRTVAVATPHDIVATGLRAMLSGQPDLRVLAADEDTEPDVLLYDVVALLDGHVDELDAWLARPGTLVVAVTRPLRPDLGALALERGVAAAVPLSADTDEVRAAVREVLAGRREAPSTTEDEGLRLGAEAGLSPRENDVLRLAVQGLGNQEIADHLFLSVNSVKTYIRSAYRKMGVTTRSQAVAWCLRHGFPPPPA